MRSVLVDIEALANRRGAIVTEIGAVIFDDGWEHLRGNVPTFFRQMKPERGFVADLDTLEFHRREGTWPLPPEAEPVDAMAAILDFDTWLHEHGPVERVWSWGATYDFPLLEPYWIHAHIPAPWEYWRQKCARQEWDMAFPGVRHAPRPHTALADALAAASDLLKALRAREGKEVANV